MRPVPHTGVLCRYPELSLNIRIPSNGPTFALLFALAAAFGCGDTAADSSTDTSPVVISDAGGADGQVIVPECAGNADCAGGEICREGVCREACRDDSECDSSSTATVCDLTAGFCVGCGEDTDCSAGEQCVAAECVFSCSADDACADGQICDVGTGECTEGECATAPDCGDGFDCIQGRCIDSADVVCTTGTARCGDADTVILCSRDGTRETEQPCEGAELCVETGDQAECVALICNPDEALCVDDQTAAICDPDGTSLLELPCRADQYCEEGICRVRSCEPSTTVCDGNDVVVCDAAGAGATITDCNDECSSSDFGCQCIEGACTERVCDAGTSACVGDSIRQCNATGLAFNELVPCDDNEICISGACLPSVCTPGSEECAGNSVVQCNGDGTNRTVTDCSRSSRVCTLTDSGASCTARACAPDAVRCVGERLGVCTPDGRSEEFTDCAASGAYCNSSTLECTSRVCEPSDVFCDDGDVFTCNARGSLSSRSGDCSALLGCEDGTCVEGCGDTLVQEGEDCDDGNRDETDDCLNDCTYSATGGLGQRCTSNDNCDDGQWCSSVTGQRRCSPVALGDTTTPMRMVYIPGGSFAMGSELDGENPVHNVTVQPFFMATTGVTNAQWSALGLTLPSYFDRAGSPSCRSASCPVESINWWEAVYYANLLSEREGLEECYTLGATTGTVGAGCTGTSCSSGTFVAASVSSVGRDCNGYRLPSEAEREFAARGGTTSTYHWGESTTTATIILYSWYFRNADLTTHPVAQLEPNQYGLYDTAGNIYEWVWDFVTTYPSADQSDPFGPSTGGFRGGRGGLYSSNETYIRPAYRFYSIPANRSNKVGLRLVRSVR
jgi:formylglycine-generating enzyme required for sulfatase activity